MSDGARAVAILADVHSNLPALEAALADVAARGIREVVVAGDRVGFGASPNAIVDRLVDAGATLIRGNHEADYVGGYADPATRGVPRESRPREHALVSRPARPRACGPAHGAPRPPLTRPGHARHMAFVSRWDSSSRRPPFSWDSPAIPRRTAVRRRGAQRMAGTRTRGVVHQDLGLGLIAHTRY